MNEVEVAVWNDQKYVSVDDLIRVVEHTEGEIDKDLLVRELMRLKDGSK